MNQRVPESSGLPLRAMVMVLLFLAVVFLLLGIQALGSGGDSSQATPVAPTTTSTAATSTPQAPPRAGVHVYNVSGVEGAATRAGDRLTPAGWIVTVEPGMLSAPDITATTVFFTDAPGEKESAEAIAKLLDNAPVEPRRPELADLPPGVIVTVTG
jgi:LytR cell envelope-related transcriptional attenuator